MGWDVQGRPYFSNPVNGLHLNGTYFFSEPFAKLYAKSAENRNLIVNQSVPELRDLVKTLILNRTGLTTVVAVDTSYTDGLLFGSGGNVHCLTLNFATTCGK